MQFCAEGRNSSARAQEYFGGDKHPQGWRGEIEPDCVPVAHMQRWPEASGRIHAHSGKWRFHGYEDRVQETDEVWCVARQGFAIRHDEYG